MDGYIHKSVLLEEAVAALKVKPDGVYVDATLGGGGHSFEIANRLKTGTLYAFDQDRYAIEKARERLKEFDNVVFVNANFADLKAELAARGVEKIDGVLYDLGVSSFQFDIPERGFSYQHDSPLDMRMDQGASFSAYDLVNGWSPERIADVLFRYGEEPFARPIAKAIAKARAVKPIATTFELVDVIKGALPAKVLAKKGHPAKQSFQAIRIAVNDELDAFSASLGQAADLLSAGGRIVAITFHSLEDRIVKRMFLDLTGQEETRRLPRDLPLRDEQLQALVQALGRVVEPFPLAPSDEEIARNPRARSAKLRVIEKLQVAFKGR